MSRTGKPLKRRLSLSIVTILLAVGLAGCPKDPYRAALAGSDDVASAVHSAITITTSYYGTGKLNDAEKATIAGYLNSVTDANMKFRHGVEAAHTSGATGNAAYLNLAQDFINAVPTDPTAFRYFSADSQQKFATVLGAVKTAINGISLALQRAKTS
jgi:hypothetical protein